MPCQHPPAQNDRHGYRPNVGFDGTAITIGDKPIVGTLGSLKDRGVGVDAATPTTVVTAHRAAGVGALLGDLRRTFADDER